ncbi:MAG: hypothetical protein ACE5RG_01855 [Candidatus Nitrosomaritimum yanchengensis]
MKNSRKALIIVFVIGMSVFGYSQYALASQIRVVIIQSDLIEENDQFSSYNVELEFENPSLLILTAGKTDFFVIADDKTIGEGKLEPFTLSALSNKSVKGTFQTESNLESENLPIVKISGVTKYDVLFSTIDVPFVYYPTEEQAREFIHQN